MTQGTGYNPSPPPNLPVPPSVPAGYVYGTQSKQVWNPGERDTRPMCDLQRASHSWRVCVYGENVRVTVRYGTLATKVIENLRTPVQITVPGQCNVEVTAVADGAHAEITATASTSGRLDGARQLVTGPNLALHPDATRFFATGPSTIALPSGPAVVLAALQELPLVAGSTLTAGDGYLEFDT